MSMMSGWLRSTLAMLAIGLAPAADFSAADALVQTWVEGGNYPGAGLWIVRKDGTTVHERWWGGYDRQTNVMIASASKWLEAATMLAQVDAGVLALDRPIGEYLPELAGSPQGRNTLRQMFSHTSSLNQTVLPPEAETADTDRLPGLLAMGTSPVVPGGIFQYGGTALAVGARAIEVRTGKAWLTVFGETIARPCGMKRTVTGHNLWTYDRIVGSSVFPTSNAADYLGFLRMLLNEGVAGDGTRVLSPAAIRDLMADQVGTATVKRPEYPERALGRTHHGIYGLGCWRLEVDERGEAVVLASTSFAGFFPWIDRKHGVAGVFVGRNAGRLDAFHASPTLLPLIAAALDREAPSAR